MIAKELFPQDQFTEQKTSAQVIQKIEESMPRENTLWFDSGEVIFSSRYYNALYRLKEGTVFETTKVRQSREVKKTALHTIYSQFPDDKELVWLGLPLASGSTSQEYTYMARTLTQVVLWDKDLIQETMSDYPSFAKEMIKTLTLSLRDRFNHQALVGAKDDKLKVGQAVLQFGRQGSLELLTQLEIGHYAGVIREQVNKIIGLFDSLGFLDKTVWAPEKRQLRDYESLATYLRQ
jgi:CRP-like cAMP-binding protein